MEHFKPGIFSVLAEMKAERLNTGKPVIDLSVGTPNIPPAAHIMRALSESAADARNYVYAIHDTEELQNAAAAWYERRYGVTIDPETEVVSLLGSQDGLSHIALSLIDPGDLTLVQDPAYPIFRDGPLLAGAELYPMPQTKENGYVVDLDAIPEAAAQKARYMVISYPNNPTASIAPPFFYEKLVRFAKKYDITVLHDNAYSELVFDGQTGGSFLAAPGAKDVGVEFNSLSKTYGLAGARIGFAFGNREMIAALKQLKSNLDYGMFLPVQKAAAAALLGPQDCVRRTREAYQKRRNILVESLGAVGWPMRKSPATMFVWAETPGGQKSVDFTRALFERSGVLATPGAAFGPAGEGHVRLALVQNEDMIRRAASLIDASGILK